MKHKEINTEVGYKSNTFVGVKREKSYQSKLMIPMRWELLEHGLLLLLELQSPPLLRKARTYTTANGLRGNVQSPTASAALAFAEQEPYPLAAEAPTIAADGAAVMPEHKSRSSYSPSIAAIAKNITTERKKTKEGLSFAPFSNLLP